MPFSKSSTSKYVPFLIIISATYFLSEAKPFQKFMPRSVCMFGNEKLILLHLVSDSAIFVSYFGFGVLLCLVYRWLNKKGVPFNQLFWQFGGFIFFCGLTHLIGVLNLKITFYWLDGILKLITAWFSVLTFISFLRVIPTLRNLRTPEEFQELSKKLDEVLDELKKK